MAPGPSMRNPDGPRIWESLSEPLSVCLGEIPLGVITKQEQESPDERGDPVIACFPKAQGDLQHTSGSGRISFPRAPGARA